MLPAMRQYAQEASPELFSAFEVCWNNEHEVWLHDKQHKKFSLLCNAATIPDQKMVRYGNCIKQSLEQRNLFAQARKHQWVADMRFADQIVVFLDRGGRHHG